MLRAPDRDAWQVRMSYGGGGSPGTSRLVVVGGSIAAVVLVVVVVVAVVGEWSLFRTSWWVVVVAVVVVRRRGRLLSSSVVVVVVLVVARLAVVVIGAGGRMAVPVEWFAVCITAKTIATIAKHPEHAGGYGCPGGVVPGKFGAGRLRGACAVVAVRLAQPRLAIFDADEHARRRHR